MQKLPKTLFTIANPSSESMSVLDQSIAGLAALAVNDGTSDEMVWVGADKPDVNQWLSMFLERHPQIKASGADSWTLVEQYFKKGIVKGYILYRPDTSPGNLNERRPNLDCSINVATSLAPILGGILIDGSLVHEAQAHRLPMLLDARDKTQKWCFDTYKDRFSRAMVCMQDPKKSNVRDFAIAQRAFTMYGDDDLAEGIMEWLDPLAPVLGWNGGDEFRTTKLSSDWGHLQTSTDWCDNLPVLMAGSEGEKPARIAPFDPRTIDWPDRRSAVSFVLSDGDNTQFLEQSFFFNPSFWTNEERGQMSFTWSIGACNLAQLCPQTLEYAIQTRRTNDDFVEWGGGYYYPDLFAANRPDRWQLLALHAAQTWANMRKTGLNVVGFNVSQFDSPDALQAYRVFAGQTSGLLGIVVFEYDAYEAGAGKILWVKDRDGVDVPVVSARYDIWDHLNDRPRAGTPAKVAREIADSARGSGPSYSWAIVHAWSWFRKSNTGDETAEDMPQDDAIDGGRGYSPALWCARRLPSTVRVVSLQELLWRIRMEHNPAQTRAIIRAWKPN